jgi:outer membrane protease
MLMLTIKKIGVLVSIITIFLVPIGAETSGFSISPTVGFLYGHAEEIVYKFPGSDLYLSELLWDLKPLLYAGIAFDFGPRDPFKHDGFTSALSLKYGLPLKTGIHENRDWDNFQNHHLTHFSRHDAFSRGAFFFDISAGYSWRLNTTLALITYGMFTYMRLSWSGRGISLHGTITCQNRN